MYLEHILNKLQVLNKTYKTTGEHYLLSQCLNPTHDDKQPSFSINTETGACKCYSCGYSVSPSFWVEGKLNEEELEELERRSKYLKLKEKLKREEVGLTEIGLPVKDQEVLDGYRGLSKDTLERFKMYQCFTGLYKDRVIFPFYEKGKVMGFTSRANFECNTKYLHNKGFSPKELLYPIDVLKESKSNYVVLVEGVIDCINLWEVGISSVCNFGVAFNFSNNTIAKLLSCGVERIYVMFDNDVAGIKATADFISHKELLEHFEVLDAKELPSLKEFFESDCKDFNEFYTKGDK